MFDMGNTFTLQDKQIEFGLTSYSSPFFRNVQFITSHTLNKLEPYRSRSYVFPKNLVTFKTPEYQSVNEAGVKCLDVNVNPGGSSWLHAIVRIDKQKEWKGFRPG